MAAAPDGSSCDVCTGKCHWSKGGLSDVQLQQMQRNPCAPHMLVMLYGMKKGEIFLGPFSTRFFTPSWNTVSPCTGKCRLSHVNAAK